MYEREINNQSINPVHMQVQMEDIQSKISLCVCWRLSEEMIHSQELYNSKMKIHPPW